jgi:predicted TIM-barrel fold metal-dependent hydrolase
MTFAGGFQLSFVEMPLEGEAHGSLKTKDTAAKHAFGHGVNPLSEDGDLVFATAHNLGIPAMVHTGPGRPFALSSLCIPAAQKYPGLSIILAHAGFGVFSAEAQVAASVCGNLFLETSWCVGEEIRRIITIAPDRVMMAAGLPRNVPVEIAKYRDLDLDSKIYDKVLGGAAISIFTLPLMEEYVCGSR